HQARQIALVLGDRVALPEIADAVVLVRRALAAQQRHDLVVRHRSPRTREPARSVTIRSGPTRGFGNTAMRFPWQYCAKFAKGTDRLVTRTTRTTGRLVTLRSRGSTASRSCSRAARRARSRRPATRESVRRGTPCP